MKEVSLADLLPYWCTVRSEDVTALITPALDYVGALELTPLDARFASEEAIATSGEALRSFISGIDDECTLHFLYRVTMETADEVQNYRAAHSTATGALAEYVAARGDWLSRRDLRSARLFLFYSRGPDGGLARGSLGVPMPFSSLTQFSEERHTAALKALAMLRNSLQTRLKQSSLSSRELTVDEVRALHFQLLNPSCAARRELPKLIVQDTLWDESEVKRRGAELREYSEAEQLLREELEEARGHLRQEKVFRRAVTLKTLPEAGTGYFSAESLLALAELDANGRGKPFPFWLATTVRIQPQGRARFMLNARHGLVENLRNAIPFLADKSIAKQTADAAVTGGIRGLFEELNAMASKLVSLSVTLLLEGSSLEQLDSRTEVARAAFSAAGNSELLLEEVSQLPAFLSLLPGAGNYQFRKKTCTSRNAGDFLPVFAPWRGCGRAVSLMQSPTGEAFRFDPFDLSLSPAHHGMVVADTGSGKSMSLGAFILDALAAGIDAILIDNGWSWKPMTQLLGGVHIDVDIKTPLTPFRAWEGMTEANNPRQLDPEAIQEVVGFLELCVKEEGERGFDKLTVQLVAKAVRCVYEDQFRAKPTEKPLMSHFREGVRVQGQDAADARDRAIADDIYRRLGLFCGDELYGTFLDRPSSLKFDAQLITFDMHGVSKSPITRSIAMAAVMSTINARAVAKNRRTLVVVDEGHAYLGQDETAERFLERCYRVMRKYSVAMWMISQQFGDFQRARSGEAIIGNSPIKIFLRHRSAHDVVGDFFKFSHRTREAFRRLDMQAGSHSDLLLMYGERMATVRLALHPLAYWILTTDGNDKKLIERSAEKNPHLSRLALLRELAARYPQGAPRGANLAA